jgi:hypothetical protein
MKKRWILAGSTVLFLSVGVVSYKYLRSVVSSESAQVTSSKVTRSVNVESDSSEPDLTEIAKTAIHRNLSEKLAQGAAEKATKTLGATVEGVTGVANGVTLSSVEAQKIANELLAAARKSGKLTPTDLERLIALQRQMDKSELSASIRQVKELLDSSQVDVSEL